MINFHELEDLEMKIYNFINQPEWHEWPRANSLYANIASLTGEYSKEINRLLKEYSLECEYNTRKSTRIRVFYSTDILNHLLSLLMANERTGMCNYDTLSEISDMIYNKDFLLHEYYQPLVEESQKIFDSTHFRNYLEYMLHKRIEETA
jgi:hypothetical protein